MPSGVSPLAVESSLRSTIALNIRRHRNLNMLAAVDSQRARRTRLERLSALAVLNLRADHPEEDLRFVRRYRGAAPLSSSIRVEL